MFTVRRSLTFPLVLAVGLFIGLAACDDGLVNPDPVQDDDVILTDEAVIVDPEDAPLESISGDTLTIVLTDEAPEFQPGNVVVGQEGGGYLRRVTSVEIDGNRATLITEQAALVDAVEKGSLRETFSLTDLEDQEQQWDIPRKMQGVEAHATKLGIALNDVSIGGGASSDYDVRLANGEINFDPEIVFDLSIDSGRIEELKMAVSGQLDFYTDIEFESERNVSVSVDTTLATFQSKPIIFFIKFVPVVIQPQLDFVAGCGVEVGSRGLVQTGIETVNTVSLGAEYSQNNWRPISDRSTKLGSRGFEWDLQSSADLKCSVRPEVSLRLYRVAGPFFNIGPYGRAGIKVDNDGWESGLYTGLDAGLGGGN